jgi:hypothetical protein
MFCIAMLSGARLRARKRMSGQRKATHPGMVLGEANQNMARDYIFHI